ncbi:MAG: phosphodiester glycosidase family protein [Lachnospiraceae bacterium]|nr:phosphodiester glycosidase family protein [Lachnospiraceae bacterium]
MSRTVKEGKISGLRRLAIYIGRFFTWLILTILVIVLGLYLFLYLINKGPSPHFRDLFVSSVMESSAGGILARLYLTDEEIAEIQTRNRTEEIQEITDVSLVIFDLSADPDVQAADGADEASADPESGYVHDDPDGDGIEIHEVHGETYSGMMMIVYDPSRVVVSSIPSYTHGYMGWTIQQHVENNGAVAGINGGKYEDNNGLGSGAWPEGVVISNGRCLNGNDGRTYGVYGFNEDNILIVGNMTASAAMDMGIRDAVTFGPALVVNGAAVPYQGAGGGLNPRTAIGQRDDGAVLMLVIEGRKSSSLGATMADLIEIMLDYGAINAANMDGGMSSTMFYEGEIIVDNATVRDTRRIPTAFIVMPLSDSE